MLAIIKAKYLHILKYEIEIVPLKNFIFSPFKIGQLSTKCED